MKSYDEFEKKAHEIMKKSDADLFLTEGEKMFLSQYIYEEYVPFDGFLLTYYNSTNEALNKLKKAYEMMQDEENLRIIKSFSKIVKGLERLDDFNKIVESLTEKESKLIDEWDMNFPLGNDEDYTRSFELLLDEKQ